MNASAIAVHWHDESQPVYSLHFQPNAQGERSLRLATGGGDNNVRMWEPVYENNSLTSVSYLCTLPKHTQAVNVVRFDPKGEALATAGDDGAVLVWTRADSIVREFGVEDDGAKESWTVRHTLRSPQSEIYDLAWLPDSQYVLTGSMDNVTRIYHVASGQQVCQIAEHNHYVQGVAWDPRNEFVATQSADRSVHVYALKPAALGVSLAPTMFYRSSRAELPVRQCNRTETHEEPSHVDLTRAAGRMEPPSPRRAPSDLAALQPRSLGEGLGMARARSSSPLPGRASVSPLPAVRSASPAPLIKNALLYHSETLQSFFRRLAFSPDGSLLLTPSGIFKTHVNDKVEETNTVYIYTRAGFNKPPVAHLPGMKKPALAVAFSPAIYKLRVESVPTAHIELGASSTTRTVVDTPMGETGPMFDLPYRMVFAVITQDLVVVYDTQQRQPLGLITNLHYSTFTDLTWNAKGDTLMISSTDGFCSAVVFEHDTLGDIESYNSTALMLQFSGGSDIKDSAETKAGDRGRLRDVPELKIDVVAGLMAGRGEPQASRTCPSLKHAAKTVEPMPAKGETAEPIPAKGETAEPMPAKGETAEPTSAKVQTVEPIPAKGETAEPVFVKGETASSNPEKGDAVRTTLNGDSAPATTSPGGPAPKKRRIAPTLVP